MMDNNDFKDQILINNVVYQLWFRKLVCDQQEKFFVQVEHKFFAPIFFEMIQDGLGKWKLIPPVPDWIRAIESELVLMIRKRVT